MFVSVSKFGRYDTRNGVQSPPRATGLPSNDTSTRDVTSASDDISSTLKRNNFYSHSYNISGTYIVKLTFFRSISPTFVNHYCQDIVSEVLLYFGNRAVFLNGSVSD